ncbi:hypothetical protein [Clostridium felsineum]|uniref:hypothetical protein n=1 Tax=Clostridium felsineum TaxID=36839 RepID=UPI00098C20F3|nr:hypothetical protein [Clostridium felsineum]URZ15199.1 hypothetical protein CLFE_012170 [Clostridium felsineum DSM 794]
MGKIGISTGEMESLAMEISQSRSKLEEVKRNLNSAINSFSLKNKSKSTEIELTNLHNKLKEINSLEDKMEKMNSNVIYVITKFTEMDKNCASRIKSSGYDYRKKIGLLTLGEKIGDNPVGNAIDSAESWYDRNKDTVDKVSIMALEGIGGIVTGIFLPEVGALVGFARAVQVVWKCLSIASICISVDTIWSNANQLYDRNVKKKSSVDIQKDAQNGEFRYGLIKGASGLGVYNFAKFMGESDKYADYARNCWMTGVDMGMATISLLNLIHNPSNLGKDGLIISNESAKSADAIDAIKKIEKSSNMTTAKLVETQKKIDYINNAQKKIDYIKSLKGNVSKTELGQYKKNFNYYNDSKYLDNHSKLLPKLSVNAQNYNNNLNNLQRQIVSNKGDIKQAVNKINEARFDIKLNMYNIPTSIYLYNKEDVYSGFHMEYFKGELNPINLGVDNR